MPKISEQKRAERRLQIVEAARRCFVRDGLHQTTLLDIIRASGLSAGAVYSYFKSKDELIFAAVADSLGGLSERIAPLFAREPLPPPHAFVGEMLAAVDDFTVRGGIDLKRVALLGWSETQRNEELRKLMARFYLDFRQRLDMAARTWAKNGAIADADPGSVAKTVQAIVLGYVVEAAILGDVAPGEIAAGVRALQERPA